MASGRPRKGTNSLQARCQVPAIEDRTGQSLVLADLFASSAYAFMWLGRLDEAATYADDALEAASLVGSSEPHSLAEVVSAAVLMWRGDFAGH
jgi:hypothetical protein